MMSARGDLAQDAYLLAKSFVESGGIDATDSPEKKECLHGEFRLSEGNRLLMGQ